MTAAEDLLIHLIDDDAAFRRSLVFLLESMGWTVASHASAEDFLAATPEPPPPPAWCSTSACR